MCDVHIFLSPIEIVLNLFLYSKGFTALSTLKYQLSGNCAVRAGWQKVADSLT